MLDKYEHHPGLVTIGSRVLFREDPVRRSLQAYRIECALGKIEPAAEFPFFIEFHLPEIRSLKSRLRIATASHS